MQNAERKRLAIDEPQGFLISCRRSTDRADVDGSSLPDLDSLGITVSPGSAKLVYTQRNNIALIDGYALGISTDRLADALEVEDDQFLSGIHGSYSAAIIRSNGDISGYCDRYGTRTLFWQAMGTNGITISSCWEMMPVRAVDWDKMGLSEMLRYRWTSDKETVLAGISQLPLQFKVVFQSNGEINVLPKAQQRRWPTRFLKIEFDQKLDETRTALQSTLDEVAQYYDNAAILLSGGVDSSLLAALSKSSFKKCLLVTPIFPGETNPELENAKEFANTLGLEHLLVDFDAARVEHDLRELVAAKGGQINFHLLAIHQLIAAIPDNYELLICGDGADTLFGLNDFRRTEKLLRWKRYANYVPDLVTSSLARLPSDRIRKFAGLKKASYVDIALSHEQIQYPPASMAIVRAIATADIDSLFMHQAIERFRSKPRIHLRRLLQGAALKCNSANIFREIELSASRFGKRVFLPFMAESVIRSAMTITHEQYFGREYVKPVLRELACEYFDRKLIYQKKHGFEVPFASWLKGPLRPLVETARQERHLFDGALLRELDIDDHYALFWSLISWQLINEQLLARQQRETPVRVLADRDPPARKRGRRAEYR
jgi:asparagine synthase (glutamine-hydrolysing)